MGLKTHIDTKLTTDLREHLHNARYALTTARNQISLSERAVLNAIEDINVIKALALKYGIDLDA